MRTKTARSGERSGAVIVHLDDNGATHDDRGSMTESTDHERPADHGHEGHRGELAGNGDPDLVSLVQMANAFGLEQSVVLTLQGQVVAGTLVGGRSHFEGLAKLVQGDDPDETLRGALAARYRKRGADFEGWGAGSKLGDLDPEGAEHQTSLLPGTDYLHLRDVSVVTGPGADRTLSQWRGRVCDIVGWTVGELEDTASEDEG